MADTTLLPVLRKCSDEDLAPLVRFIKKAEFTETLSKSYGYHTHYPKHSMYVHQIAHHVRLFGGSTIVNFFRDEGPPYKEIVQDVARKLKVDHESYESVERIELKILIDMLKRSFDRMSDKEREEVIKAFERAGAENMNFHTGFPAAAILAQIGVKMSGFLAYQIAVIVANGVAKAVLGHGLRIATNAALTRALAIFAGPIGWIITGLWTAIDIAGPAYRVTIPCVCHVAYLRQKMKHCGDFGDNE